MKKFIGYLSDRWNEPSTKLGLLTALSAVFGFNINDPKIQGYVFLITLILGVLSSTVKDKTGKS